MMSKNNIGLKIVYFILYDFYNLQNIDRIKSTGRNNDKECVAGGAGEGQRGR